MRRASLEEQDIAGAVAAGVVPHEQQVKQGSLLHMTSVCLLDCMMHV